MDLDDRAHRAAHDLRRRVEPQIDLTEARAALAQAEARHRSERLRRGRIGLGAVTVLALVGAFAVAGGSGGGGRDRDREGDGPTEVAIEVPDGDDSAGQSRAAAILNALPRGPIDGKASWRLPVVVEQQTGLADGDTVTVYGRGFEPNQSLGIVQCSSEADTSAAGVSACQLAGDGMTDGFGGVTYATASSEGTVVAQFQVSRYLTTPDGGEIDCQSAPERCLVGVGAISNYDQSGGAYIDFAGAPPFAEPTMTIDPSGPYAPGQQVQAQVRGLVPLRSIRIEQCVEDQCETLLDSTADVAGNADLAVVLQPSVTDRATGEVVPCADACVLRGNGIGVKGGSSAPLPADVPLEFTSDEVATTEPTPMSPDTSLGEPTTSTSEVPATTTSVPGTVTFEPGTDPEAPADPNSPVPTTSVVGGP